MASGYGGYQTGADPTGADIAARAGWLALAVGCGLFPFALWLLKMAGWLVASYLQNLVKCLAPEWFRLPDHRLIRSPDHTPGVPSYYLAQAFADVRNPVADTVSTMRSALAGPVKLTLGRRWYRGSGVGQQDWFHRPLAIFSGAGVVAGLLVGGACCGVVAAAHLVWVSVIADGAAAAVVLLRCAERARLAVLRIRLVCPHPNCHMGMGLPVYRCDRCGESHQQLRPGRDGVFRHTCECGSRLPTALVLGRHRLAADCPQCKHRLPDRIGTAPSLHVLLVGPVSAGKTMLMMAGLIGLDRLGPQHVTMRFAASADKQAFETAKSAIESGGAVDKTGVRPVPAFLMYVGDGRRRRRLVYFYDPPGEFYDGMDAVQAQEYLAHVSGAVVVIDPLSIPDIRRQAEKSYATLAKQARPARVDSEDAYNRVVRGLRGGAEKALARIPVAVVVTKSDALRGMPGLTPRLPSGGGQAVREWLLEAGMGNFVRSVEHEFREAHYYAVSAIDTAANPATADGPDGQGAAVPLLGLLRHAGLDVADAAQVQV
jgi:hypothetical protein